jgi:Flp pilus assembly pilin Flp
VFVRGGWQHPRNKELNMMQFLATHLARLQHDEAGQGLVEYLLILALVAFAAVLGMGSLANGINTAFSNIAGVLNTTVT